MDSTPPEMRNPYKEYIPPHNLEAEQAVLGAILMNNECLDAVRYFLKPEHFYEPVHARMYEACVAMVDKGQIADPVKLKTLFEHDQALIEVGGSSYLVNLVKSAGTLINTYDYGMHVHELALKRHILLVVQEVQDEIDDPKIEEEVFDIVEGIESKLAPIIEELTVNKGSTFEIDAAVEATLKMVEDSANPELNGGISTGLIDLDNIVGSLYEGDLIILGGRPKMGKTTIATNVLRAVVEDKKGAVMFSLEMPKEQLVIRLLTDLIEKHYKKSIVYADARRGKLVDEDHNLMKRAGEYLSGLPLFIDDSSGLTLSKLRLSVKRLCKRWEGTDHPLKVVIVDYLQLMEPENRYKGNKNAEVGEITKGLKRLAKETGITLIALSQLSRGLEGRECKIPMLSDLRDSGSIEQDADSVWFCYREAYYAGLELKGMRKGTNEYSIKYAEVADLEGKMDIVVAAQRQGPADTARVRVNLHSCAVRDLNPQEDIDI